MEQGRKSAEHLKRGKVPTFEKLPPRAYANLIVRYALMSDEELPLVTQTGAGARQSVEDHLVFVAMATLGLNHLENGE